MFMDKTHILLVLKPTAIIAFLGTISKPSFLFKRL